MVVLVSVFAIATLYYYNKLASEIDVRLQGSSLDNSVAIFTGPFTVSVGDRLPITELLEYLQAAGYHQKEPGIDENVVGSFNVSGDEIEIVPGASSQAGLYPVRIRVDQKSARVASITTPNSESLPSTRIEGSLLAAVRDGDRRKKIEVQFSDIPRILREAIVSVEDRRFFSHNGVDWRGVLRALKADIDQGELVQGGSTLTQQLIKNEFLTADRTLSRKLKEAAMAVILESRLSKEQIFTVYCNDVYLGQSGTFAINGFAQAAQVYFDKRLDDLTLAESAFLAGLICAPNRYSAHRDPERALERRNRVLDAMAETGAISQVESAAAKAEPLRIQKHETTGDYGASYFIDYAQRFLDQRYSEEGLSRLRRITTTMDPRLQRAAYGALTRQTDKLDKILTRTTRRGATPQPVQAALVALDAHTGEVLAMVGGRGYDESQLNRATDAKRQPGSAFKPFVYATALTSRSYTAASLISDTPQTFTFDGGRSEYKPSNYHGAFTNRNVTLREALTRSLNVPSVSLAMSVGLVNVANVAERSGLERPRVYPSMALGTSEVSPLELAGAYTAFANGGTALRPIPIRSTSGDDNPAAAERLQATSTYVFSPQVAYLMTNLMQSVVDSGTAAKLRAMGLKGAMAGKTGTTDDGWFVGYTPNLVCAVWVGFDDNRDLRMKASDAALPMWADFMKQVLELRPELGGESFARPGGIVSAEIDPLTGCLAGPETLVSRTEIFIAGTEPSSNCYQETLAATDDSELDPTFDPTSATDQRSSDPPTSEQVEEEGLDLGTISLEVCSHTGFVASPDCPNTERKTFAVGKEPHERCSAEFHRQPERVP